MNPVNFIAAIVAGALLIITGSYAGQQQDSLAASTVGTSTLRLTVVDLQAHVDGDDLGDNQTFAKLVLGSSGNIIGTAYDSCVIVGKGNQFGKGLSMCNGVYNLPKGKLTFQGTRRSRDRYSFVVTGGSGIYINSGGSLNGFQIGSNPFSQRVVIHIIGR